MSARVRSIRHWLALRDPAAACGDGRFVVVGAGKGGVGTSTVAALLALESAEAGAAVLLIDAEDGPGTQQLLLNVPAGPGILALRDGEREPGELIVQAAPGVSLITAGCADPDSGADDVRPVERRVLLRRLVELFPAYDRVIVDAGSRPDTIRAAVAMSDGRLLAVTAADRIALAATHALIKTTTRGATSPPIELLVNGASEPGARAAFDVLRAGVTRFLGRPIRYAGALPEDAALRLAVREGRSMREATSGSPVAQAMSTYIEEVLEHRSAGPRPARFVTVPHLKG